MITAASGPTTEGVGIRFVENSEPSVVMKMPGCYERLVNTSHKNHPLLKASPAPVARNNGEFESILAKPEATPEKDSADELCYCTNVRALIALNPSHCAFESANLDLEHLPADAPAHSLNFVLSYQNGSRKYQIFRVISQRAAPGDAGLKRQMATLIDGKGVDVEVTTSSKRTRFSKAKLEVSLNLDSKPLCTRQSYRIRDESVYGNFREALTKAQKAVKQNKVPAARDTLRAAAERIAGFGYSPIVAFARSLTSAGHDTPVLLGQAKERILDALAVEEFKPVLLDLMNQNRSLLEKAFSRGGETRLPCPLSVSQDQIKKDADLAAFLREWPRLALHHLSHYAAFSGGEFFKTDTDVIKLTDLCAKQLNGRRVLIQRIEPF